MDTVVEQTETMDDVEIIDEMANNIEQRQKQYNHLNRLHWTQVALRATANELRALRNRCDEYETRLSNLE